MSDAQQHFARHFQLDPSVIFLNHGSFGACPTPVLQVQQELRQRMEREPVRFFMQDLEPLLDEARAEVAAFVGAHPQDLAFVNNATTGVNAVLRSLRFQQGDELLVTDHEYNACRNVLDEAAERSGAQVVVAGVPYPLPAAADAANDAICEAILRCVTPRTRLLLVDHVTSQTALVLPVERIVAEMTARGVDTLVDGAHAPGMLPLRLSQMGAAYYTGNCHKWLCAPKGAALLHVRRDRQHLIHPAVISHGRNSPRRDRSRFLLEFDWPGTVDPTAYLSIPTAMRFLSGLLPGGFAALREHNHALCLWGRRRLCQVLGVAPPCPEELIGFMATVPLPDGPDNPPVSPFYADPLQQELLQRYNIQLPVMPWPVLPHRLLRISAQIYNTEQHYERLAEALGGLL